MHGAIIPARRVLLSREAVWVVVSAAEVPDTGGMLRWRSLFAATLSLLSSALSAGCAPSATQLVVVVDTDLSIPSALDEVRVQVTGPSGMMETETSALGSRMALPLTLAVIPDDEMVLGPIDVIARGYRDGVFVIDRAATVTLVRGETRVLSLFLLSNCVSVSCPEGETCGDGGDCEGRVIETLPPWTGTPPRIGMDGGMMDSGAPLDVPGADVPGLDAPDGGMPDGGPPCLDDTDCDDGVPCTADSCGATGCQFTPNDAMCDDGNPCTDGTCSATGCAQANNTAPCDDGTYCNGVDVCAGGACTHPGDPCLSPTTCDETANECRGCTTRAQCPPDATGAWSSCDYADGCDESATRSRTDLTYACTAGSCVPSSTPVTEPCTRDTDGGSCGVGSCGGYGGCDYADGCDEAAVQTRICTDLLCTAGTCTGRMRNETMPCSRDTDGTNCGAGTTCGAYGACDYSGTCDESAMQTRTCTDIRCATGSCGGTMRSESMACSRTTNGNSCGSPVCGAWSTCSYASSCATSGTQSRTCMDPICSGGGCGMSGPRTEMQSCGTRATNGMDCGTTCGAYGACNYRTPCDEDATQSRTCTPRTCSSGSCVTGSATTEFLGCTRSTEGNSCDVDLCSPGSGSCSAGMCSGTSYCAGGCECDGVGNCVDMIPPIMAFCPLL